MNRRAVAVEPRASDNPKLADDAVQVVSPPQRPSGKFMYPGGTRPLDGYTVKRGVGQGGFGEIYYALSDAGKEVGLKLIRRNLEVELRGIRQCLNLKHPNLLSLYDIRQDDVGDTWVIMEFVGGASLQEALEAHPDGLPVEEVLAWIHGIGAAMAYLHDHGIVHRDLKPGNVFSDEGVVKVGDYGLSKFISCSRRSGHTESIGTVHYMAPEVANGRYGKELDVYALGVILYEILTGRVPFDGESVGEVLMKHLTARPDVSPIPEQFRAVIARALEKDPEKRYCSASEMLAALPPSPAAVGPSRLPSGSSSGAKINRSEGQGDEHFTTVVIQAEAVKEMSFLSAFPQVLRQDWKSFCQFWNHPLFRKYPRVSSTLKTIVILAVFLFFAIYIALASEMRNFEELVVGLFLGLGIFLGSLYFARVLVFWLNHQSPAASLSEKPTVVAAQAAAPLGADRLPSGSLSDAENDRPKNLPGERSTTGMASIEVVEETTFFSAFPQALRHDWKNFCRLWNHPTFKKYPKLSSTLKTVVVLAVFLFFAIYITAASFERDFEEYIVGLFLGLGIFFGSLYLARVLVFWLNHQQPAKSPPKKPPPPAAPDPPQAAPAVAAVPARAPYAAENRRHWRRHEKPLPALVLAPPRQRVTELLGSLLMSTLAAAAMTVVLFLISGFYDMPLRIEHVAWLFLTGVAGSWTILIPAKLWEGTYGEPALRRFVMMVLGLGLGVLACGLASFLLVNLPSSANFPDPDYAYHMPRNFFGPHGQPLLPAFVACFGTLFFVMRWWRQADPLRSTRLSLKALVVSVVVAGAVAYGWQFPQPWLPMVAASMSVSVQLASPWFHPSKRTHPRV